MASPRKGRCELDSHVTNWGSDKCPNSPSARLSLIDQLDDSFYAIVPDTGKYSKPARARKERIAWLRKKYKDDPQSLALAGKLEGCMRGDRASLQRAPMQRRGAEIGCGGRAAVPEKAN